MSQKEGTCVATIRLALTDLQDDEPVVFTFHDGEEENGFSVDIHRSVNGYVEVDLQCLELTAELKKLRDESEELTMLKGRYATALQILERDAGVTELDLDAVENSVDPVGSLVRMRQR